MTRAYDKLSQENAEEALDESRCQTKARATCGSASGLVQRETVCIVARAVAYVRNHRALQTEPFFPRLFLPLHTDRPVPPRSCVCSLNYQPIHPLRISHLVWEEVMVKNTTVLTPDNTPGPTPARRRSEDELDSNRAHKKPRTRVRYAALSNHTWLGRYIECGISYSCGECHRRKQKVSIYLAATQGASEHLAVRQTNTLFACRYFMVGYFQDFSAYTGLHSVLLAKSRSCASRTHRARPTKTFMCD